MKCEHCGKALPSKGKFCRFCGNKIPTSCISCDHVNPAEAEFCSGCGTRLGGLLYCESCGKSNFPDATECRGCGNVLRYGMPGRSSLEGGDEDSAIGENGADRYVRNEASEAGRKGIAAFFVAAVAGIVAAMLMVPSVPPASVPVVVNTTVTVPVTPPPIAPQVAGTMPPQSITTPQGLRFSVAFDHETFLTGQSHDPVMLLTFTALGPKSGGDSGQAATRVDSVAAGGGGRNLVLALDTSGSMERGGAMAHLRAAALSIIDRMNEKDSLAIVTYSTSGSKLAVPSSGADRSAMKAAVSNIEAVGGTNLSEGLTLAFEAAKSAMRQGGVNRILLFSDGKPTVGETDGGALLEMVRRSLPQGATMSTFGLGAEFNEELLTSMAEAAGGNYHYAGSPESLPAIFSAELDYMGGKAFRNLTVSVFPQSGSSIAYTMVGTSMKTGEGWRFNLEDLKPGETKKILAKVKFSDSTPGIMQLFSIKAQYETDGSAGPYLSESLAACVELTADSDSSAGSSIPEVQTAMHLFELSTARREAAKLLKENRRDKAIPILEKTARALSSSPSSSQESGQVEAEVRRIEADLLELKSADGAAADQGMAKKLHFESYKYMRQKNY